MSHFEDAVRAFFRPEMFNRLDAVVPFAPLPPEIVSEIAVREIERMSEREGLVRRGIRVRPTSALLAELAVRGFDKRYGARPLLRAVETICVAPLARFLIENPDLHDAVLIADVGEAGEAEFTIASGAE
jgi:ATP-dependent Clp protease ATP-binding subunit ClpA